MNRVNFQIGSNLKRIVSRRFALPVALSAIALSIGLANFDFEQRIGCRGVDIPSDSVAQQLQLDADIYSKIRDLYKVTNQELCDAPDSAIKKMALRTTTPKPDQPGEWARFREMQRRDESGQVRADGILRAIERRHAILKNSPVKLNSTVSTPSTATTSTLSGAAMALVAADWTNIGPGNIGGRVRAIAFHPTTAGLMWAGSVAGGLWRSSDAGLTWAPVNDFMSNLSISSIAISSTDANTMYVGTGEGFFNGDAVRGAGILKSTDGGVTWNPLPSTNPANANSSQWYYVNRLAMHPTDGNTILAATRGGGIYRTTDGGTSWTNTLLDSAADVKFDPLNGNNAIMGPAYYNYNTNQYGGTIKYSRTGGQSWNNSNLTVAGRVEIAYSRTSGTIYASVDVSNGQIYKSTDGGATWSLVNTLGHLSGQGWYNNTIWVDPTNSNHVITGGLDLWRSTNGGVNFTKISDWTQAPPNANNSAHADNHVIASAPNYDGVNIKKVYFGNDGGVFAANDISVTTKTTGWANLNNGISITQFYGGAGHNGTNGRIIGGTQDNGSLRYTGSGTNWVAHFGGDGGYSAIDPTDGNYIYGEYVYLQIHRSTSGGTSGSSYIYSGIGDAGSNANFIAPFILDPNNPNTMLAGGASLWRSTNVKATTPTWATIKPSTGSLISAIEGAKGSTSASNIIFVGHNNGTIFKTTTGIAVTPSWTQLTGLPSARSVLSIYVDPANSNIVYAGYGGYSNSNLWKSSNGGSTWTSIGTALPPSPVRAITTHPQNSSYLYVGTEVGIFTSQDSGATWTTTNSGPANASVERLFWLDSTNLVAATHGRSMFKATINLSATTNTLTVTKIGTGTGTVTSAPAGIDCGSTCRASFSDGTLVTLTPSPNAGSIFTGWSGACSGTGSCVVSMSATQDVTAIFNTTPTSYLLTVAKSGAGTGSVTSTPAGIDCGGTCSASIATGTSVTLTATAASGSTFAGWSGVCSGTGTCTITMNSNQSVSALFNSQTATTTLQNLIPVTGLTDVSGGQMNFSFVVPAGVKNLQFNIAGGAGNADLYVRVDAAPTTSTYTCRSIATNNTDACFIASPTAGMYYIMIKATASYSNLSLIAAYTSGTAALTPLTSGTSLTNRSGRKYSAAYYSLFVPANSTSATIQTFGGSGDLDLYVRKDALPTTATFDCRPYTTGNAETCSFMSPAAGMYYVMLYGYSSYSKATLKGTTN